MRRNCARSRRISLFASFNSVARCSELSGATALTHLYKLCADTPSRADTSVTEYLRSIICRTAYSLNSGVKRWVLMDFLLCSNHRPEMSKIYTNCYACLRDWYGRRQTVLDKKNPAECGVRCIAGLSRKWPDVLLAGRLGRYVTSRKSQRLSHCRCTHSRQMCPRVV